MPVSQSIDFVKPAIFEDRAFLSKLNAINFGPLLFKLMHFEEGTSMTREQAETAVKKYKMLLFLNFKYPNGKIVPNKLIDKAWHAHLLDSELYDIHCLILFERKLHHFPYFGLRGLEDARCFLVAAERSKDLFEQYFGIGVLQGDLPEPSLCCDGRHSDFEPNECTGSLSEFELVRAYAKLEQMMKVRPVPLDFDNDAIAISLV